MAFAVSRSCLGTGLADLKATRVWSLYTSSQQLREIKPLHQSTHLQKVKRPYYSILRCSCARTCTPLQFTYSSGTLQMFITTRPLYIKHVLHRCERGHMYASNISDTNIKDRDSNSSHDVTVLLYNLINLSANCGTARNAPCQVF